MNKDNSDNFIDNRFSLNDVLDWVLKKLMNPTPELVPLVTEQKKREGPPNHQLDTPFAETKVKGQGPVKFILTTFFLRRCYEYVMPSDKETLCYISGIRLKDCVIMDELIKFDMDRQETCYVSGNIISSTKALMTLTDRGFPLTGTVHCHPGRGAAATTPSGIDKRHHGRLEQGGFKALGIIMTEDGYVRFYSDQMPFKVDVIGKDGRWINTDTYYLDLDFKPDEAVVASRQIKSEAPTPPDSLKVPNADREEVGREQ